MKKLLLAPLAAASFFSAACGGGGGGVRCGDFDGNCVYINGGDTAALLEAANGLEANTTIVLGAGTFTFTNALTIRSDGAHIVGQSIEETILDFGDAAAQSNGIDVIGDDFLVQDLTVLDAKKDGIRVEASDGVVFRRIRATWTNEIDPDNGAYGIYPVSSQNVLVEDSFAENASDAGLYVGQCQHVIVRRNTVRGNVAGLEIENTQFADVYENTAEDNTAGIVVFDLPGNLVVGRDVRLRNNIIRGNNRVNFGKVGTTVAAIPVGTGTFAMASRRVEIVDNTYENNNTVDIAIISGAVIEPPEEWVLQSSMLIGDVSGLNLMPAGEGLVMNFRSENIVIRGNTHTGSGDNVDIGDPLNLGVLLTAVYGGSVIDNVLYDSIGEGSFHPTDVAMNTNDNNICVGGNTGGTFASMNLAMQMMSPGPFFRPASPFAPFDCTAISEAAGGPVVVPNPPVASP